MLTDKDINRIMIAVRICFRDEFTTKHEFAELRQDFRELQTAVDGIAKQLHTYHQEVVVLNHRVTKVEKKIGMR